MGKVRFSISLLLFWLKGEIEVDSRFVKTKVANTILGFIPAGRDQQNIPLKNISGSMISTKFFFKPFAVGLFIIIASFAAFAETFAGGLVIMIVGLAIAANGIQTLLVIEKAGSPYILSVPFFEKQKMESINGVIHDALAADTDKTDLNMFFDRKDA